MVGAARREWTGVTRPHKDISVGLLIMVAAFLAIVPLGGGIDLSDAWNIIWLAFISAGGVVLALLTIASWLRVTVALEGERLEVRFDHGARAIEWSTTVRVSRSKLARVEDHKVAMRGLNVFLHDPSGRYLVGFPRFLQKEEHAAMMAAILEWGGLSGEDPGPS